MGDGAKVTLVIDASPWGLGGYLMVGLVILAFFADDVDELDEQRLGVKKGTNEAQQCFEALCALVALRL